MLSSVADLYCCRSIGWCPGDANHFLQIVPGIWLLLLFDQGAAPICLLAALAMLPHTGCFAAGYGIRAATTLCRSMMRGSSTVSSMPTLMPSLALAVTVPADLDSTWQQQVQSCVNAMLWRPQPPDGQQHQQPAQCQPHTACYQLRDVLAGGVEALGGQGSCSLNGWLLAQVSSIGQIQDGYMAAGGAESRWDSRLLLLVAVSLSQEMHAYGNVAILIGNAAMTAGKCHPASLYDFY